MALLPLSAGDRPPLRVQWFDEWHSDLDQALGVLPQIDEYSNELIRLIGCNQVAAKKRIALVIEKGDPKSLILLRRQNAYWVPAMQWMLPGALFPSAPGYEVASLAALKLDVEVAWWRMAGPPPSHPSQVGLHSTTTYGADTRAPFEECWRETGMMKDVLLARKRCKTFEIVVDRPDSSEWIIHRWASQWSSPVDDYRTYLEDRLLVSEWLRAQGKMHSFLILDQGTPIGGATLSVHRGELVAGYIYRDPNYKRFSLGTRLIDFTFSWAAGSPYTRIDLGGGFGYKEGWAPPSGERWKFHICPPWQHAVHRMMGMATRAIMKFRKIKPEIGE